MTSAERRARKVARRNVRFGGKTLAEKRVWIARDALAWLRAGALKAAEWVYVQPVTNARSFTKTQLVGQARDVNLGVCNVCALGALMCAKAVRYDETRLIDLLGKRAGYAALNPQQVLKDYFSLQQLAEIESYYEMKTMGDPRGACIYEDQAEGLGLDYARLTRAAAAPSWDMSRRDRLEFILENIIEHGGDFVVP